ncbi:hypothetical protein [Actinoplanes sp. NPDC049802]|uniref:hypothetical protein n=1 Tax=Actinoplanes sp. NPDC049802 TaxID=3154742 RepID=UPI003411BA72
MNRLDRLWASRVVFMDAGVLVERGSPAEVFGLPREERTREFLRRVLEPTRISETGIGVPRVDRPRSPVRDTHQLCNPRTT